MADRFHISLLFTVLDFHFSRIFPINFNAWELSNTKWRSTILFFSLPEVTPQKRTVAEKWLVHTMEMNKNISQDTFGIPRGEASVVWKIFVSIAKIFPHINLQEEKK